MAKKRIELEEKEYALVHLLLDQLIELSSQSKAKYELHPVENIFETYEQTLREVKNTLLGKRN